MHFSFFTQELTVFFMWLTIPPWLAGFIFSFRYIKKRASEFRIFYILTFLCNIALLFANNWFTFLTVYETLTLFSLPLIFHDRSREAISGGKWYFYFSLLSGVLVFCSVIMQTQTFLNPSVTNWSFYLRMLGFIIKCGAFPFHVWLPEAHPVAPSPASAVLSGSIIKIGLFGLLFQTTSQTSNRISGEILLWISVITMFYGVIWALFQSNIKKMLAYHSVSQMGYVLLGVALYWLFHHESALIGSLTHALNHAYFKSALFIASGIQYLSYHSLDMYTIKHFFSRNKVAAVLFLVAVFGISGFPLFNGFVSKNILHEALLENTGFRFQFIESVFLLTAIGTLVSNTKWFYLTVIVKEPSVKEKVRPSSAFSEWFPMLILGFLIFVLGLFPLNYLRFLPASFHESKHLLEGFQLLHHPFLLSISGFLYVLIAGLALLLVGLRRHWFHIHLPEWFKAQNWWLFTYSQMVIPLFLFTQQGELWLIKMYSFLSYWTGGLLAWDHSFDRKIAHFYQLCYINPIRFCQMQSGFESRFQENLFSSVNPALRIKSHNTTADWITHSENSILHSYKHFFEAIKFLFSLSYRVDQQDSRYYEKITSQYGKIWIKWLLVITIILIMIFFFIFRKFFL